MDRILEPDEDHPSAAAAESSELSFTGNSADLKRTLVLFNDCSFSFRLFFRHIKTSKRVVHVKLRIRCFPIVGYSFVMTHNRRLSSSDMF